MRFLGAAVTAVLAACGVVAVPVADAFATDNAIANDKTADSSSADLVASSTIPNGIKPKVVIISHVGKASYVRRLGR